MPYANAGGVKLYYESAGEGTPLILHGHGHSGWMVFQIPYFSQFYRVITFDRRGTGRSDDPPAPWSMEGFAADVRNLMDALDIDKAIVGGNSLGGAISSQFGLDYPDRALALIVGHTVPWFWPLGRQWIQDQIDLAQRNERVVVMQPRSYDWEEEGPPTVAPGFADTAIGRYMATLSGGLGSSDATIKMLSAFIDWDQRPRYTEMQPARRSGAGHRRRQRAAKDDRAFLRVAPAIQEFRIRDSAQHVSWGRFRQSDRLESRRSRLPAASRVLTRR